MPSFKFLEKILIVVKLRLAVESREKNLLVNFLNFFVGAERRSTGQPLFTVSLQPSRRVWRSMTMPRKLRLTNVRCKKVDKFVKVNFRPCDRLSISVSVVRGRGDVGRGRKADLRIMQNEAKVHEVLLLRTLAKNSRCSSQAVRSRRLLPGKTEFSDRHTVKEFRPQVRLRIGITMTMTE